MKLIDDLRNISAFKNKNQKILFYDEIISKLRFAAKCGLYREWFYMDEISDENRIKLETEGFDIDDINEMYMICISWDK